MILDQLLDSTQRQRFLVEYYLRLPFARPGGCQAFCHLGSWEVIGELLAADADVLVGRSGTPSTDQTPRTLEDARRLLAAGQTIGIRHAERQHAGLAELADAFSHAFAAPIDVHLYATPAEQTGFGWHYDAEEVFILQTFGTKDWWLRKNTVNPWPLVETLPQDMRYEREIMPVMHCTLAAGDWLYIPAGYWHRTQAMEESISISVGVTALTALDLLDFLRTRLLDSLRWRQRLPTLGEASLESKEELLKRYQEIAAELGEDLSRSLRQETLIQAFLAKQRGRSEGDAS